MSNQPSTPNGGLVTETNRQYYAGAPSFLADGNTSSFTATFDTDLVFANYDNTSVDYAKNNFKLYTSPSGLPNTYVEYTQAYTVSDNVITFTATPALNTVIVVQLKTELGGLYGDVDEYGYGNAYGNVVEDNYGSYAFIKVSDIVTNYQVGYVGIGKIISQCKRTDIIFHTKRALQELSYDTLPTIKSQEVTVPDGLSLPLPQDYVNYVRMSWVDKQGVKHIIYPTTLTSNPTSLLPQDWQGISVQDNFAENVTATSLTEERWAKANDKKITGNVDTNDINTGLYPGSWYGFGYEGLYGERYGLNPETTQNNGWFTLNQRVGKISFSSNLRDKLIIFEYISDGLAYDKDMRVPKLAEEAVYAYLNHAILSTRANTPEYIVNRYRKEKSVKFRNAKIRLSNVKLDQIVQVMRNKSKWIKT